MVDNLSPFTPDIGNALESRGIEYSVVEYSSVTRDQLADFGRVILSGRRKNNRSINAANSKMIKRCAEMNRPLLGICYGAEIIALTLGGTIRRMPSHIQGHSHVTVGRMNALTGDKPALQVYESHAFCVARLPADFVTLAYSKDCEHEIFSHTHMPIFGTQFHPEKSGTDGLDLLGNFVKL